MKGPSDDVQAESGLPVAVRRIGRLVGCCALIDDSDETLETESARGAWHDWLALSNALQLPQGPSTITTLSLAPAETPTPAAAAPPTAELQLSPEWAAAYEECLDDTERRLVADLAYVDVPLVTVGDEIGRHNVPVDLSWPDHRVAVFIGDEPDPGELENLRADGWTVASPTVDAITETLKGADTTEGRAG